ncbi:hypothetical protein BS47DRAFT_1485791 [Hydnum rufescens UP504]|uniref:Uncharacterized protein n=1 Tax=Hydnum rufescens UP504 TaxID=1448309 RepID=A0A9P6DWV4_9AGAM|nr:hypothetical protein BS47DRAFT_1485791 [Hydnum rufescens UP504]
MALVNDLWNGPERIVLGIDLGTVYSAVAYSYLCQGGPRSITSVSEWPDQAKVSEPRVPTLLWYDRGKPAKCGASALTPNATQAKKKGWQLAKLFKLHVHPETMKLDHTFETSDLPDGVTISQIYSDYMAYLVSHTRHFFEGHVLDGGMVWDNHFESADIIITHPNGWGIREQHFLRKAAIDAGFPDPQKTGPGFDFSPMFGSDWLKRGVQFAMCDAGGSTVDITTYEVTRTEPSLLLKETRASASVPAGAIFVARAAQRDLNNQDKAAYAEFGEPDIEPHAINKSDPIESAHRIIQKILPLLARVLRILEQIICILENAVRLENELAQEDAATSFHYEISLSTLSEGKEKVVTVQNDFSLDMAGDPLAGKGEKESGPIEGAIPMSSDEEKVVSVRGRSALGAARTPLNGEVVKDSLPFQGVIPTLPLSVNEARVSGIQNSLAPGADNPPKSGTTAEVVPIQGVIDTAVSFDPYVDMIVAALRKQTAASEIKHIFLVGTLSKSQYLCRKLIVEMAKENRQITVVDDSAAKLTAEGAASGQDLVNGRACRFSYGVDVAPIFAPHDKEHQGRQIHRLADGRDHIHHEWSQDQNIKIKDSVSRDYVKYYNTGTPKLSTFSVALYAFTTVDQEAPRFMRDPHRRFLGLIPLRRPRLRKGFRKMCDLSADLSRISGGLERLRGPDGAFWVLNFSIGIEFGGVELQAYVEWVENGFKRRGGVTILPSEVVGSKPDT